MTGQQHPYFGITPRPIIRLTLCERDGTDHELTLIADTGSPYPLILNSVWFNRLVHSRTGGIEVNVGRFVSGWVHLYMPELGMSELVKGYSGKQVDRDLEDENPDLDGIAGLPILRLGEYGGNATDFWFRYPTPTPPSP